MRLKREQRWGLVPVVVVVGGDLLRDLALCGVTQATMQAGLTEQVPNRVPSFGAAHGPQQTGKQSHPSLPHLVTPTQDKHLNSPPPQSATRRT